MTKVVLIDGDLVSYPCAAASETAEETWVATSRADETVSRILEETQASSYQLYIGGDNNFRYKIYDKYKANRTKPKPRFLNAVREHLVSKWNAQVVNDIETDDRLGIENNKFFFGDSIVASFDKDLLMLPGVHYNWKRQEWLEVDVVDGMRTLYAQAILGDGADNIPGYDEKTRQSCPKFIEKLQVPLFEMYNEFEMYEYVQELYNQEGNIHLNRNLQLLYILREEGEVWLPPHKRLETSDEEQNQNINLKPSKKLVVS